MLQVEVVCDWCNVREVVRLDDPYKTIDQWMSFDGLAWAPLGLDMEDPVAVESCDILCPVCRYHVAWQAGELQADDETGRALYQARGGLYWHELKRAFGVGLPPRSRSETRRGTCAFCGAVFTGVTPEAVHTKIVRHTLGVHPDSTAASIMRRKRGAGSGRP